MLILDQVSKTPKPIFPLTPWNRAGVKLEIISHSNCLYHHTEHTKKKTSLNTLLYPPPWVLSTYLGNTVLSWKTKRTVRANREEDSGQEVGWAKGSWSSKEHVRGSRGDGSELSQDGPALLLHPQASSQLSSKWLPSPVQPWMKI